MATNSSAVVDPEFNDNPDWLELYNASDIAINLYGYYLTDNLNNPDKWRINISALIPAYGYIIIWTDGLDTLLHASFKLSLSGEEIGIYNPNLEIIDSVIFQTQKTDVSKGKKPDGTGEWVYFMEPTPGTANTTQSYSDFVSNVPEFSVLGGIFNTPFSVELFNTMGGIMRYTLDGSEPDETSVEYASSIPVDITTIIRARIFKEGQIPGPVVTHTYFIDDNINNGQLPVFSLASDPDNFWDPDIGIYVQDFKPDWEIPVNVELFENNGSDRAAFNYLTGIKINGLYSWQLPQKMLGVYFRKKYSEGNLEYPLFFDRNRRKFGSFALRASGSDWSYTMFMDGLLHMATQYNMDVDIQGFRPSIVYINGQYMGIHNIREKVDDNYIENTHGLEASTFDLIENENFVEAGDLDGYNDFLDILEKDLSIQENYNAVAEVMDIKNFTDYVITEIYSSNTSVTHNVMAWKPKTNGKWKWVLMDLDRSMGNPETNLIEYYSDRDQLPLKELLKNDNYRKYFGMRMADQLFTTFHPKRMKKLIDYHQQLIENEMPRHIERWEGTTSSYGDAIPSMEYWYNELTALKQFADARPMVLLNDLSNYGFDGTINMNLSVIPQKSGKMKINGLKLPEENWAGPYLENVEIELSAENNPGYSFIGWAIPEINTIIAKESIWKYLDNGSDQGKTWYEIDFDDNAWVSGPGQLGYGDGDEKTIVSYGRNSSNKYITTYFRLTFQLDEQDKNGSDFNINLLCDDGAIVYLNGVEIIRYNMDTGDVDYLTLASSSISGDLESTYLNYSFDHEILNTGKNVIAVEIHQRSANSSDISFDLEMSNFNNENYTLVSTDLDYKITLTEDINLACVYESTGQCLISEVISEDLTITKSCSPALALGNVYIEDGVTLTIEPGVEVWMPPESNLYVYGKIIADGSTSERILFKLNPDYPEQSWGSIIFNNSPDTSYLRYTTIEGASEGPVPIMQMAAISAFKANLVMDNLIIEDVNSNPIVARYSDITLSNSSLHSKVIGDLINIKYGKGRIENCVFRGNDREDTDAIDYDDVEDGIIRKCKIYNFFGFNSDAIDIGEKAKNIVIDSLLVYNITDKGVSFGQKSTGSIKHCTFVNCNLGLGLKDSCRVIVDHCNFYNTGTPVTCYEKNLGSAGGNGIVTNCIFSNSYEKSYSSDNKSSLVITYSISDNDSLPDHHSNLYGNPGFDAPSLFNFKLEKYSVCVGSGNDNEGKTNLGSYFHGFTGEPSVMINNIHYNTSQDSEIAEYFTIYNPGKESIDLSDYQVSKGITFTFPQWTIIEPDEEIFITEYKDFPSWSRLNKKLFQWSKGNLSDEGETIQLIDKYGIVVDNVKYETIKPWPDNFMTDEEALSLISTDLDNHLPENWTIRIINNIKGEPQNNSTTDISVYPNPSNGKIFIKLPNTGDIQIEIFSITGNLLLSKHFTSQNELSLDLSDYKNNLLLLRIGNKVKKIIITD